MAAKRKEMWLVLLLLGAGALLLKKKDEESERLPKPTGPKPVSTDLPLPDNDLKRTLR